MAEFSMKRETRRGSVRYRLEGVFTGQAAFDLREALATETGQVELDFSHVRQFFDFGLAAFATELSSSAMASVKVELVGLGLHHRRLLQYFGFDLERDRRVPMNDELGADPLPPVRSAAPA
jgi:hypothetical protein